jgi:hypothetical protein
MAKLIFDVSSYQGLIDFDKLLSGDKEKPAAMIIRAGISYGYIDKYFVRNYTESCALGIPTVIYVVHRPDADHDKQVDAWYKVFDLVKFDPKKKVVIVDEELDCKLGIYEITDQYFKVYDRLKKDEIKQITYTAKWFTDSHMSDSDRFSEPKFHLAAYGVKKNVINGVISYTYREMGTEEFIEDYIPPMIPTKNVLMHQFTDRWNDSAGKEYGMESHLLDASRWIGTEEEFSWAFGTDIVETEPTEPPVEEVETTSTTVNAPGSTLTMRDENMKEIAYLADGCPIELPVAENKSYSKGGKIYSMRKVNVTGYCAENYLE